MQVSRLVATVSGFPVQFNKAIVGKNAFAHESGIHQDGMLKNAETFEIMRPEDVGLNATSLVMGKHSGRAGAALEARGARLSSSGDNQLGDVFVRFKALADTQEGGLRRRPRRADAGHRDQRRQRPHPGPAAQGGLRHRRRRAPPTSTLAIDGVEHQVTAAGDGPVDAAFVAVRKLVPNTARLALYQVHAVTEGTDAQATVSVRLEEDGKIATGQSADTDTVVASTRAYVNALNKLLVRRLKTAPEAQSA